MQALRAAHWLCRRSAQLGRTGRGMCDERDTWTRTERAAERSAAGGRDVASGRVVTRMQRPQAAGRCGGNDAGRTRRAAHGQRNTNGGSKHCVNHSAPEFSCAAKAQARLNLLDREARRQRLLQLVRLVRVHDAQRVQVLAAADLELGRARRLLDLDGCGGAAQVGVSAGVRAAARPAAGAETLGLRTGGAGRALASPRDRPLSRRRLALCACGACGRARTAGVLPARRQQEILDLHNLLRLRAHGTHSAHRAAAQTRRTAAATRSSRASDVRAGAAGWPARRPPTLARQSGAEPTPHAAAAQHSSRGTGTHHGCRLLPTPEERAVKKGVATRGASVAGGFRSDQ